MYVLRHILRYMFLFLIPTVDYGIPSEIKMETANPHFLNVTWKKTTEPVNGYRVYCYPAESKKAEIVKDVHDGKHSSVIISGLKPDKTYRVGIKSVSQRTESKLVFSEDNITMRMYYFII